MVCLWTAFSFICANSLVLLQTTSLPSFRRDHTENLKRAIIKTIWQSGGNGSFHEGALRERRTLQTAACRIASKPPSGASRLRDTICFWTSWLKRSTSSVRDKMWRKPNVGTQFGNNLYLRMGARTGKRLDVKHETCLSQSPSCWQNKTTKNTTEDRKLPYGHACAKFSKISTASEK